MLVSNVLQQPITPGVEDDLLSTLHLHCEIWQIIMQLGEPTTNLIFYPESKVGWSTRLNADSHLHAWDVDIVYIGVEG